MMPLPGIVPLLTSAAILIGVIIVARWIQKRQPPIKYPEIKGAEPRSNSDGESLAKGVCPVCGCDEYYHGEGADRLDILYCAGEDCRQGFRIYNYGGGKVWAERVSTGPDRFYRTRVRSQSRDRKQGGAQ
jgi:hypothetical protein